MLTCRVVFYETTNTTRHAPTSKSTNPFPFASSKGLLGENNKEPVPRGHRLELALRPKRLLLSLAKRRAPTYPQRMRRALKGRFAPCRQIPGIWPGSSTPNMWQPRLLSWHRLLCGSRQAPNCIPHLSQTTRLYSAYILSGRRRSVNNRA